MLVQGPGPRRMNFQFSSVEAITYNGFAVAGADEPGLAAAPSSDGLAASPGHRRRAPGGRGVAALLLVATMLGAGIGYSVGTVNSMPAKVASRSAAPAQAAAPGAAPPLLPAPPESDLPFTARPFEVPQIVTDPPGATGGRRPAVAASPRKATPAASPRRRRSTPPAAQTASRGKPAARLAAAERRTRASCEPGRRGSAGADCENEALPFSRRLDLAFERAFPSGGNQHEAAPPY